VIAKKFKAFSDKGQETMIEVIDEAILFANEDWFYPVVGGIPRLAVEAFLDHSPFLSLHLADYPQRKRLLEEKYADLLRYVIKKNKRTRQSFSREWGLFDYQKDKTWEAGKEGILGRFLLETAETTESLDGKLIFDAGCGNGLLNRLVAEKGASILGMDISNSIERAYAQNSSPGAWFIQGDLQFPPVSRFFDLVHSSGVLHHTNDTERSFGCIEACVRPGGKLSVWLYHPRKDLLHRLFNRFRSFSSKLPPGLNYYLIWSTLFPVSFLIKRLKGNRQNKREMMIALLDWFAPEFRWEHTPEEAAAWFSARGYEQVRITTSDLFGFNMTGVKPSATPAGNKPE
jgi:SAM-dependent methyltransferase